VRRSWRAWRLCSLSRTRLPINYALNDNVTDKIMSNGGHRHFRVSLSVFEKKFSCKEILMPLFDFLCLDCGRLSEILSSSQTETPRCKACGGVHMKKMLSAPSPLSGVQNHRPPGRGDIPCCGTTPSQAGCAGPGSCCGKARR